MDCGAIPRAGPHVFCLTIIVARPINLGYLLSMNGNHSIASDLFHSFPIGPDMEAFVHTCGNTRSGSTVGVLRVQKADGRVLWHPVEIRPSGSVSQWPHSPTRQKAIVHADSILRDLLRVGA